MARTRDALWSETDFMRGTVDSTAYVIEVFSIAIRVQITAGSIIVFMAWIIISGIKAFKVFIGN